jgi:hypothetical protein
VNDWRGLQAVAVERDIWLGQGHVRSDTGMAAALHVTG